MILTCRECLQMEGPTLRHGSGRSVTMYFQRLVNSLAAYGSFMQQLPFLHFYPRSYILMDLNSYPPWWNTKKPAKAVSYRANIAASYTRIRFIHLHLPDVFPSSVLAPSHTNKHISMRWFLFPAPASQSGPKGAMNYSVAGENA